MRVFRVKLPRITELRKYCQISHVCELKFSAIIYDCNFWGNSFVPKSLFGVINPLLLSQS